MRALFLVLQAVAITACATAKPQACSPGDARPGVVITCEAPGFARRGYDVYLPSDYAASKPVPVVLAIHGGGGNARAAACTSCPGGWGYLGEGIIGPAVGGWSGNRVIFDFFRRHPL